jgi:predicted ferric reductase
VSKAMKLVAAVVMLAVWVLVTFYIGILIYFAPLSWRWFEGAPQSVAGILLVLLSLLTYAFAASRLFGKETNVH